MHEPVELFAVTRGSALASERSIGRRGLAAIGLGAVAVMALAVVALALPGLTAAPPTSIPSPTPRTLEVGPLELGTYVADEFHPPFSFTIDDPGWSIYRVYPDALGLQYGAAPDGRLDVGHIPLLYSNPCGPGEQDIATGTSVDDLVAALESATYLQLGEVKAAEIGGNYAVSVDVTVDPAAQAACGGFGGEGIAVFPVAEDVWRAMPGEVFRLQAVDVDATTISYIMSAEPAPAQSVEALEQFFERAQRIVQSIEF